MISERRVSRLGGAGVVIELEDWFWDMKVVRERDFGLIEWWEDVLLLRLDCDKPIVLGGWRTALVVDLNLAAL